MKRIILITVMLLLCNIQFVFAEENKDFDGEITVSFRLQVGETPEDNSDSGDSGDSGGSGGSGGTGGTGGTGDAGDTGGSSGSGTTSGGGAMTYTPDMFYNNSSNSNTTADNVYNDTTTTTTTTTPAIDPSIANPETGDTLRQIVKNIAIVVLCITGVLLIGELVYKILLKR